MKTRHALLVVLVAGLLLTLGMVARPTAQVHAEEEGRSPRPTATPARPIRPDDLSDKETGVEAALPDLVVRSIRVRPDPALVNRPVTVEVTIANQGGMIPDGHSFFVDLYVNPASRPEACASGNYFWSVQGFYLDDGTHILTVQINPNDAKWGAAGEAFQDVGTVILYARVDNNTDQANNACSDIDETNENNNLSRATAISVSTRSRWEQTTTQDFQNGFSSALDLTHPQGVLQNGTGWFEEPDFPYPEDPEWPIADPNAPWESPNFYNPDRHIAVENYPDDGSYRDLLQYWRPPNQMNIDLEVGFNSGELFAVWEDSTLDPNHDIFFAHSTDSGATWSNPVHVSQSPEGTSQQHPDLVVDRQGGRLYVFWQDNQIDGSWDIFFARSLDTGATWEVPATSNPVNDKNVDPNADQIHVTAEAFYEGAANQTHLFVAWEDYRNGNADIFFEWSADGGNTWQRTRDSQPGTVDGNIHVLPDPATDAKDANQRYPKLFLDRSSSSTSNAISYCIGETRTITVYNENDVKQYDYDHHYPINPYPRVFIVWEDDRDLTAGIESSIYYTRGEFNYVLDQANISGTNCAPRPKENLPQYRFEDDHVRVNSGTDRASKPVGDFNGNSFLSLSFEQAIDRGDTVQLYQCEARWQMEELVLTWQQTDENENSDIWSTNIFEDIVDLTPVYVYVRGPGSNPPSEYPDANVGCLGKEQTTAGGQPGPGEMNAPTDYPKKFWIYRNDDVYSPQLEQFYELSLPEEQLEISEGLTFQEKPLCLAPAEEASYSREPSNQTDPDMAILAIPPTLIEQEKRLITDTIRVQQAWNAWADSISFSDESFNQDIFLRPVVRYDLTRTLSVQQPNGRPIFLQTVQNNIKNQVVMAELDLFEERFGALQVPHAQMSAPSVAFHNFTGVPEYYVGWDDNRNANLLLGSAASQDIFAARLKLDDTFYDDDYGLRPTRTASYVSQVFVAGQETTWYDIQWWGDISTDGTVTFQTRFGMDPNQPEPPQDDVAENGWTKWTGLGGAGGEYTAPGQHIRGPDGSTHPQSYYIQYRVNFNRLGGGQQGISCISEVRLNYEVPTAPIFLPIVRR